MKISFESFTQASEIPPAETITGIMYGESGTGKTEFCADSDCLYVDVGRSKETILSPGFKQRHPNANPLIISISEKLGKLGAPDAADAFDATCDAIDFALANFADKFSTIVVDEASGLGFFARTKGIYFNSDTKKSNTKDALNKQNILAPAVQDFGAEMNLMEQFVRGYADTCMRAGKHFILVAHEQRIYGDVKKIGDAPPVIRVQPYFTGKDSHEKLCGMVDWVFRFETQPGSAGSTLYRVRTNTDGFAKAKCRHSGVFQSMEKSSSLREFIEKVKFTYKGGNN